MVFRAGIEWFYDGPPNFSLTKQPVLKPASGCKSFNMVSLEIPKPLFDRPLHTTQYLKTFCSWHPSSCRAARKRSLQKIAGFEGGYIYSLIKKK